MQKKSKGIGKYFRTGDVVCVEMDMDNRTISFVVAGVKTLAYSDVPTDNPLCPVSFLSVCSIPFSSSLRPTKQPQMIQTTMTRTTKTVSFHNQNL